MSDLKPCPFCGSVAVIFGMLPGDYHAGCTHCPCEPMSRTFRTRTDAKTAWNQRTQPLPGVAVDANVYTNTTDITIVSCAPRQPGKPDCETCKGEGEVLFATPRYNSIPCPDCFPPVSP